MSVTSFLKEGAALVAHSTGALRLSRWHHRHSLLIIGWHGVSLNDEHRRFPSLFISPETFRKRLEYLSRCYRIISLNEAMRQKAAGGFQPNQVVLTFDDGYFNFLERAVPILREFRAPATVYMVSSAMESQRPFENLMLRDMILLTKLSSVHVDEPGLSGEFDLTGDNARQRFADQVLKILPDNPDEETRFSRRMSERLQVDYDDLVRRRVWTSLSPTEVAALAQDELFSFQNHTHDHLNVVSNPTTVYEQALKCRERLEQVTGTAASNFCYPTGLWSRSAWDGLQRAGITSAATTLIGPNFPETPNLCLRRLLDGERMTQREFVLECSHLRWFLYTWANPAHRIEPSEKTVTFKSRNVRY